MHGDYVGHGFACARWAASALQHESRCGGAGPSACSDTAYSQLPDEIGVEEDVDGHRAIVARDRPRMNEDPVAILPELCHRQGRERDQERQDRREQEHFADAHDLRVWGQEVHEEAGD